VGRPCHEAVTNVARLFSSLAMADNAGTQPNTTLYINNLNDKINKDEIRSQLYALFTTYGKLIDVVATKTSKMRGQAFLVFTDLPSATAALRACDGMIFYNKPMVRPFCSWPVSFFLMLCLPCSVFHMQKPNRMQRCAVRTLTLSHRIFPRLLLPSVCVRPKNLTCVLSERG
jgi:RNA recognition motif-containing protein